MKIITVDDEALTTWLCSLSYYWYEN